MPAMLPGIEDAEMNSVKVPALVELTQGGERNKIIQAHK